MMGAMGEIEQAPERAPRSCANCRALMVGEFCHQCGQRDRELVRGAFSMMWEAVAEMFELDSRVRKTIGPLFFKPGFLSREWVAGRRASYVTPVRLYLFVSIVFFIVLSAVTQFDTTQLRQQLATAGDTPAETPDAPRAPFTERTNMQIDLPWLSEDARDELKRRINVVAEDPDLLFRQARTLAPQLMFVLLPLFALILKVLYLFARRYYVEHLVLALHTHTFMFASFVVLFALSGVRGWAAAMYIPAWAGTLAFTLMVAVWVWIPIYLFLAQKRFYGQGWVLTTVKYLLTGTIYFMIMIFALVALILLSIATA